MTGQRRANWETKLDAVVEAHRDVVSQWLEDETNARARQVVELRGRIEKLERDRALCVWAIAALILAVGILAVSR